MRPRRMRAHWMRVGFFLPWLAGNLGSAEEYFCSAVRACRQWLGSTQITPLKSQRSNHRGGSWQCVCVRVCIWKGQEVYFSLVSVLWALSCVFGNLRAKVKTPTQTVHVRRVAWTTRLRSRICNIKAFIQFVQLSNVCIYFPYFKFVQP